jgi:hypothetical protein
MYLGTPYAVMYLDYLLKKKKKEEEEEVASSFLNEVLSEKG